MGISKNAVRMFLHESKRRPLGGSLLTLGRQDVFATVSELNQILEEFGHQSPNVPAKLSHKPELAKDGFISDRYLYEALGFADSQSMDASSYEGADLVFDLNKPPTPWQLKRKWDVVFDGGTIEHVFHLPNALSNIFRFLKIGGRIIHVSPSSNHIDHGFYMFSPTFFWDYYLANQYEINTFQVISYSMGWDSKWEVSDYVPGGLTRVSMGGLDDALYAVIVIATKTENSTCGAVPQQGLYASRLWQTKGMGSSGDTSAGLDPNFKGKGLGLKVKYLL